jgi:hypothetical protein
MDNQRLPTFITKFKGDINRLTLQNRLEDKDILLETDCR